MADAAATDPVFDALADADANTTVENVSPADVGDETLGDARVVIAVGEASLLAVARRVPDPPVVPVETGVGRYDVSATAVGGIVGAAAADTLETVAHPVLEVAVADDPAGRAVLDVALLTADPARISEFAVDSDDGWRETVRADGVVAATPMGSTGYAHAVGARFSRPEPG